MRSNQSRLQRSERTPALLILLLLCVGCSRSGSYPSQPITLLCPWSAGGGTDRVSRQVAYQLEGVLGVPVNVINATGGSGVTGHTRGAQARPDGYTLTTVTVELNMLHWRGLTPITYENFQPLHLLNRDSAALFVQSDSDIQTLDQLRDAITKEPGALKASGTAFGGIWHVAMAGWLDQQGVDPTAATWISINGSGPSIQELNAGGLDFICCSLPEVDALLAAGKVRCLGVMADERVAGFEAVPTFIEQGHDWSIAGWRGIAAPKGIPEDRLQVLQEAINQVANSEELQRFMGQAGFNLSLEGNEQFGATLERQDRLFEKVLTGPAFSTMSGDHFGPMIFPVSVVVLLITLLVLLFREQPSPRETHQFSFTNRSHSVVVISAIVFYWYASERIGFFLSASGMLIVMSVVFASKSHRRRRLRLMVPLSLALSAAVYQVFAVWLSVPLPRGWIGW